VSGPLEFHSEYALKIDEIDDAGYRHFEGSRRFEALKIWMTVKHLGADRYAAIADYLIVLARNFANDITHSLDFMLMTYPDTNIVCFRYVGLSFDNGTSTLLHKRIQQALYRSGSGPLVSLTTVANIAYFRVVLTNPTIDESHLRILLQSIRERAACAHERPLTAA
jgi:L-2,4-diaminobutyrate decarboxylase